MTITTSRGRPATGLHVSAQSAWQRASEWRASWLLSAAAVLSAFRGGPFRLPGGLIIADLVVVLMIATAAVGYRPRRRWLPLGLMVGTVLIAVGLIVGSLFGDGNDPASFLASAARDVLPPMTFASALSLQPVPSRYAVRSAWLVSAVAVLAVLLILLAPGEARQGTFLRGANYAGHFVITGWIVLASVSARSRLLLVVSSALFILAVFRTGSFGAMAGLIGLVTYLVWVRLQPSSPTVRLAWRLLISLGMAASAVLSLQALGQSDFDLGGGTNSERLDRSYSGRVEIWTNSIDLSVDNPFGLGYAEQVDGVLLAERLGAGESHNDLLTMLMRGGVLAALGEVLVITTLWKFLPRASWSRAMLVFWFVTAMSRQTWNFRHFWLCLAIVFLVEESQRLARQRSLEVPA